MFTFQRITLADRERMTKLFARSDFRAAEYSFANAYNWSTAYHIEVAYVNDFLLMRAGIANKNFLFPAGSGDLKSLIQQLLDDAHVAGQPLVLRAVVPAMKAELERLFPSVFVFSSNRDSFDYMYLAEDLRTLAGKKFQPKRNHISRFKKTFAWSYEDITPVNLPECVAMNEEWCALYGCSENPSLQAETCAVRCALRNYAEECLMGGLLRVDGKVVAYTIGERLNTDTLIVHIEKALGENYPGAYQVINQEFVTRHAEGLTYVNREDDAGDEGLRKAKLSYQPVFMQEKFIAKSLLTDL